MENTAKTSAISGIHKDISVSWRESQSQPWKRVAGGFNTEQDARRWAKQCRRHMSDGEWLIVINPSRQALAA